jgi:hypothetical protein
VGIRAEDAVSCTRNERILFSFGNWIVAFADHLGRSNECGRSNHTDQRQQPETRGVGNPRRCRWAILLRPFRPRTGMYPKRLRSAVDLHRCTDVGNFLQGAKKCQKVQSENWASTARRAICKSNINQWIGDEACVSQRVKKPRATTRPKTGTLERRCCSLCPGTGRRAGSRMEGGGRRAGSRMEGGGRRAEEENQEYE